MKEQLSRFFNKPGVIPISVGIISFGAGAGLGYILGKRNRFEVHTLSNNVEIAFNAEELAEMEEIVKEDEEMLIIPVEEVKEIPEYMIDSTSGKSVKVVEDKKTPIIEKVVITETLRERNAPWSYAQEIKKRSPSEPYIIHQDEFFSDEKGYTQSSFTYYAGDNIMNDEDDTPVYNHEGVVGSLIFGHGSDDPNVVYVRNEKLKAEYEISFDPGLYSVEVLGLTIEDNERAKDIQHSKNRKFRME